MDNAVPEREDVGVLGCEGSDCEVDARGSADCSLGVPCAAAWVQATCCPGRGPPRALQVAATCRARPTDSAARWV